MVHRKCNAVKSFKALDARCTPRLRSCASKWVQREENAPLHLSSLLTAFPGRQADSQAGSTRWLLYKAKALHVVTGWLASLTALNIRLKPRQ